MDARYTSAGAAMCQTRPSSVQEEVSLARLSATLRRRHLTRLVRRAWIVAGSAFDGGLRAQRNAVSLRGFSPWTGLERLLQILRSILYRSCTVIPKLSGSAYLHRAAPAHCSLKMGSLAVLPQPRHSAAAARASLKNASTGCPGSALTRPPSI